MINNASLLEEMKKDQQAAVMPRPAKATGTKAILSKSINLGGDVKGMYDDAMSVKGNIEYLKDDTSEGAERALGVTASTASLASTGTQVVQKGVNKGAKLLANKILTKSSGKNVTDLAKLGKVSGKLGKVAGALGAIGAVASFGGQVHNELSQSSALHTGRGFESTGNKLARGGNLAAGAVGTAAAVGTAVASVTGSVAATNFWNPIGWIAAGVGIVASGIGWLANKSKIGGGGRFTNRFNVGGYLGGGT